MSNVTITWNPNGFLAAVEQSVDVGLDAASNVLANQARRNIIPGRKGTPSKPGQYPHVQTNNLRTSIGRTKAQAGTCLVGSGIGAPYGLWLEFGTTKMAPRPWLRRALASSRQAMFQNFVRASSQYMRAQAKSVGGA